MDFAKGGFSEAPQVCKGCGVIDETRPYGANNEELCITCCKKNPKLTASKMMEYFILNQLGPQDGLDKPGNLGDFRNYD